MNGKGTNPGPGSYSVHSDFGRGCGNMNLNMNSYKAASMKARQKWPGKKDAPGPG